MGLLSAMTKKMLRLKHQSKRLIGKLVKNRGFFSEISSLASKTISLLIHLRYPPVSNIFIHFFFNNIYQNWILKIGGRVV